MNCTSPLLDIYIEEVEDALSLRGQWQTLEKESDAPFFLSWHWIGNWLALKPDNTSIKKLSAIHNGRIVALGLFTVQSVTRHLFFRSTQLHLHEYGLPGLNMVIEHNGFLVAKGYAHCAPQQMLEYFVANDKEWDEIKISAICELSPLVGAELINALNLKVIATAASDSKYVDLGKLRSESKDYLSTLSSNTRYQLRRAIKKYSSSGPVTLKEASGVDEALEYFDALKELHQEYWRRKGLPGSFANPNWEKFNRAIITEIADDGEAQLLKITAGEQVIGYLYNLVRNGHVNMIQSGFNYNQDPSLHPGYVSHYLAIEHNLKLGNLVYDFLMGDARYKQSLSNGSEPLIWVVLQRKRLRFYIENTAKDLAKYILRRDKNIDI